MEVNDGSEVLYELKSDMLRALSRVLAIGFSAGLIWSFLSSDEQFLLLLITVILIVTAAALATTHRAWTFYLLIFAILVYATSELVEEGTTGFHSALFVLAIFVAGALGSRKAAVVCLTLSIAIMLTVAALIINGVIELGTPKLELSNEWDDWSHYPIVLAVVSAVMVLPTDLLLSRLAKSLATTQGEGSENIEHTIRT